MPKFYHSILIFTLIFISAKSFADQYSNGVFELSGIDENLPYSDLNPINRIIGNATSVAFGESIHASGGLIQVKFRLIKHLVEQHNFRVLALELNRKNAESINSFVQKGEGTALSAAKSFGIWASSETVALLSWMRSYNIEHANDMLGVFGFDAQQPKVDHEFLTNFILSAAPQDSDRLLRGVSTCNLSASKPYGEGDFRKCLEGIEIIERYLHWHRLKLIAATSRGFYNKSRLSFIGFKGWQIEWYYYRLDIKKSMEARDLAMADLYRITLNTNYSSAVKSILWAHNWHISMRTNEMPAYKYAVSMGTHLKQYFRNRFVAIGIFAYEAGIDWPNVGCGIQPISNEKDSIELILNNLGYQYLFADLSVNQSVFPHGEQFKSYISGHFQMEPWHQFHGLLFLRRSEKMYPINWQPCST
jgi:erythromycin esterase-like protein